MCTWHGIGGIAELGVLYGKTTKALLGMMPRILVWAIDTWRPGDPALEPGEEVERRGLEDSGYRAYSDVDMERTYQGMLALQRDYPDRLQVLRLTTLEAAELFPDGSLDAIFLDADHRTLAVKADLMAWVPKVRETGMIFGHDFGFHSVRAALDEMLPGWSHHHAGIWSIARSEVDPAWPLAGAGAGDQAPAGEVDGSRLRAAGFWRTNTWGSMRSRSRPAAISASGPTCWSRSTASSKSSRSSRIRRIWNACAPIPRACQG